MSIKKLEKFVLGLVLGLVLLSVTTTFLYALQDKPAAGENGKAEAPAESTKTLLDIINAGSWVGHTIILISIVTTAIVIQLFMTITRDKLAPPEMVVEIETLLEEQQFEELVAVCEGNKNYITSIVSAALAASPDGYESMEGSAGTEMEAQNLKLNQQISYLSLMSNVGPLLGLFGTVTGMIGAFMVIEQQAVPTPKLLARGVYEALVTTVEGMIVGIPGLALYFYFKNKVTSLTFELGTVALEFVAKLKPIAGQEIVMRDEEGK